MTKPVEQAWKEHQQAIERVRSPATATVERASAISTDSSDLDRVVATSEQLRASLAQALATESTDVRDLASMKLLAAASYDLGLAKAILEQEDAANAEVERSSAAVFADTELREILETPFAEMKLFQTERTVGPRDSAGARKSLQTKADDFFSEIPKRSAATLSYTVSAAINFGFGPAHELASAISQELLAKIPEGLSRFVGYAVKLIREAILKLWDAFGKDKQKELLDEAQSWLKKLLEKQDFAAGLLEGLYGVAELRKEVSTALDGAEAAPFEQFNRAATQLDELLARHKRTGTTLEWVVRGIGWVKAPLIAAPPWGPAVAYGVYAGVIGYAIYLGGDYLDAKGFGSKWLDHVQGARAIVLAATQHAGSE